MSIPSQMSQSQDDLNNSCDLYSTKRSKNGCLTCKIRKKKCKEDQPICSDCKRLNKECIWIDYTTMSEEEIKRLKDKVRQDESVLKLRKRKSKSKPQDENKYRSTANINFIKNKLDGDISLHAQPQQQFNVDIQTHSPVDHTTIPSSDTHTSSQTSTNPHFNEFSTNIQNGSILIQKFGSPRPYNNYPHAAYSPFSLDAVSPRFNDPKSPTISSLMNPVSEEKELITNQSKNEKHERDSHEDSPPPLDLDYFKESDKTPGSPIAFLNFLREVSSYQSQSERITEINGDDKDSPRNPSRGFGSKQSAETEALLDSAAAAASNIVAISHSPNSDQNQFNLVNFTYPLLPDQLHPDQTASPTNFNIPSFLESVITSNKYSSPALNHLASNFNAIFSPPPQPSLAPIPSLNEQESYLYNHYEQILSRKVSIAPSSQNESNSYQKVFLPLAHRDKGVLYGLLAWAAFHLGGEWIKVGTKFVDLALDHVNDNLSQLKAERDKMENMNFPGGSKESRQSIVNKLATLLILCGAEICRGDVKYWSIYLSWGWKILYTNGGILNFSLTKEEHWLISNFAYHDLLASSTSERGTYFPSTIYDKIFNDTKVLSKGNLNPLLGISKKLYKFIGDINTLVFESKKILRQYYSRNGSPINLRNQGVKESEVVSTSPDNIGEGDNIDVEIHSDMSNHAKIGKLLSSIIDKSKALDAQIDDAKPDPEDLENLSDEDLELQLTLFEAFQLSAKLLIRQSLMKCNPSSLESQVLANDLTKCVDILLGTPVQASMAFPIFMAGIHCVTIHDRIVMKQRVDRFMKLYGHWSVIRTQAVMEKVWAQNPDGDKVVDWFKILKDLDWDINFA